MPTLLLAAFLFADPNATANKAAQGLVQMLQAFANLASGGTDIWNKLATPQAKQKLQEVATAAANLNVKNEALKASMRHSIKEGSQSKLDVCKQEFEIKHDLDAMHSTLVSYAVEIDKSAHPIGEKAREVIGNAVVERGIALGQVCSDWSSHKWDDAVISLEAAIVDLNVVQDTVTCLQDSITRQAPACDPEQLRKMIVSID